MKPSTLLIALTVFVGVFGAMGTYYQQIQNTYAPTGSTLNSSTYIAFNNTMNDYLSKTAALQNKTIGMFNKPWYDPTKVTDAITILFIDTSSVLIGFGQTFQDFMTVGISSTTGVTVPGWFISIAVVSVIIIFTFRIITIAMRSFQDL